MMGRVFRAGLAVCAWGLGVATLGGAEQPREKSGEAGAGLRSRMASFQTDVPAHALDIVLARPTATSITVSVVSGADAEAFVGCRRGDGAHEDRTPVRELKAGAPAEFVLSGLSADTEYVYQVGRRPLGGGGEFELGAQHRFHTARRKGEPFTFTVQADSHLDGNVSTAVYERTLANALADKPDFHVDLGDTFMTDKRRDYHEALAQYAAQRYYLGELCHSAPLFMVLGNHDGEWGYASKGMGAWAFAERTNRFPAPEIGIGGMYSGRTAWADGRGGNYYAFEWGDALLVVLDPFSFTEEKARGGEGDTVLTDESWGMTLGRTQYDWLDRTLARSGAKQKFVFIHHLVGGRGRAARGGVESTPYFEWGGKNADGSEGFAAHRAGWAMSIHRLLVERGVTVVFHGHDHLYVHAELDGVTYQCVPQPGNARGGTRSAAEYGYKEGRILGSPGHLRVRVGPGARVEFVRATVDERGGAGEGNGAVVDGYELRR